MTRVLVVGLGALGGRIACQLSAAGVPVMALERSPQGTRSLTYVGRDGIETRAAIPYTSSPSEARDFAPLVAFVTVKAYKTWEAAEALSQALPGEALAVTLQNGLGNLEALASVLGEHRTAAGVCTYGAHREGDRIFWGGDGQIRIGSPWGASVSIPIEVLKAGGFDAHESHDIRRDIWTKAAVNCCINPLTALLRVRNGELRSSPWAMEIIRSVIQETVQAAGLQGVALDPEEVRRTVESVMEATGGNRSSMLQDVEARRPTEIGSLSLKVAEICRDGGLNAPLSAALGGLVRALEDLSIPKG